MRSLAELLDVATRLSPRFRQERQPNGDPDTSVIVGDHWLNVTWKFRPMAEATILAAVMEGVEEKGWHYALAFNPTMPEGQRHGAMVFGPNVPTQRNDGVASAAHALLAAFVAALEAEAKQ